MSNTKSFMRRSLISMATLVAIGWSMQATGATPVPGAIFTAKSIITPCDTVNSNIYDDKPSVFLNGGPKGLNGPGLPANTSWYVQVTDPSGLTVLGTSLLNATPPSQLPVKTDATGKFVSCYRLTDIVSTAPGLPGYNDTPNNGGEYKVWVSEVATFDPNLTKTDNFKVRNDTVPPQDTGRIVIRKFYDANANGQYDPGEQEMFGWKVDLLGRTAQSTMAEYAGLGFTMYVAQEYTPIQANWYATSVSLNGATLVNSSPGPLTLNAASVTLSAQGSTDVTVAFGNVCTGAGGGYTLGFWSNKNGEANIKAMGQDGTLAFLTYLNLKSPNGSDFNPTTYAAFRNWLLNGNAVNMAYMLSVQLAAMELNVKWSPSVGNTLIYAPGTNSANVAGFATVQAVMDEANASLAGNGQTFPGVSQRNYQEYLKNALDNANNNRTFVQATPASCPYTFNNPVTP